LGVHFLFLQQKRKWTKRKRRRISIFLKVSEMRAHSEFVRETQWYFVKGAHSLRPEELGD